jgi:hypothetical protein
VHAQTIEHFDIIVTRAAQFSTTAHASAFTRPGATLLKTNFPRMSSRETTKLYQRPFDVNHHFSRWDNFSSSYRKRLSSIQVQKYASSRNVLFKRFDPNPVALGALLSSQVLDHVQQEHHQQRLLKGLVLFRDDRV